MIIDELEMLNGGSGIIGMREDEIYWLAFSTFTTCILQAKQNSLGHDSFLLFVSLTTNSLNE